MAFNRENIFEDTEPVNEEEEVKDKNEDKNEDKRSEDSGEKTEDKEGENKEDKKVEKEEEKNSDTNTENKPRELDKYDESEKKPKPGKWNQNRGEGATEKNYIKNRESDENHGDPKDEPTTSPADWTEGNENNIETHEKPGTSPVDWTEGNENNIETHEKPGTSPADWTEDDENNIETHEKPGTSPADWTEGDENNIETHEKPGTSPADWTENDENNIETFEKPGTSPADWTEDDENNIETFEKPGTSPVDWTEDDGSYIEANEAPGTSPADWIDDEIHENQEKHAGREDHENMERLQDKNEKFEDHIEDRAEKNDKSASFDLYNGKEEEIEKVSEKDILIDVENLDEKKTVADNIQQFIHNIVNETDLRENQANMTLNSERVKNIRAKIADELNWAEPKIIEKGENVYLVESSLVSNGIVDEKSMKFTDRQKLIVEKGHIYVAQNKVNGKVYVGQTINTLNHRMNAHVRDARYKKGQKTMMQNALLKYGLKNFILTRELTVVNEPQFRLDWYEKYFIKKFESTDRDYGYNLTGGGSGGKHTPEVIERIRNSQKGEKSNRFGVPMPVETKEKIRKANTGKKHTEETKRKMSKTATGRKQSEATKKLLSDINSGEKHPFFGKHHTEETKQLQRIVKLGDLNPMKNKHHTEETKEDLRNKNKDKEVNDEYKRKISDTKKENFMKKHPIEVEKFKNFVGDSSKTWKDIRREFDLHAKSSETWLNRLYGTRSLNKARQIQNGEITKEQFETQKELLKNKKNEKLESKKKSFLIRNAIDSSMIDNLIRKKKSVNQICSEINKSRSVLFNYLELFHGDRSLIAARKKFDPDYKTKKQKKTEIQNGNYIQNSRSKNLGMDFNKEIDINTRDLRFERIKNIRKKIKKELSKSEESIVSRDWGRFRADSILKKSGIIPKNLTKFTKKQWEINEKGSIYLIQNKINGKVYIGQTIRKISDRWVHHVSIATRSTNPNSVVDKAIKKYGADNFNVKTEIEIYNKPQYILDFYEQMFISKYDSMTKNIGYNRKEGGSGGKLSLETRKKISEAHKGKILDEEHKQKISKALKNHPVSQQVRNAISKATKGKPGTNNGKTFSEQHRRRISEALKGRPVSDETRKKISNSLMGNIVSPEARKKIGDAIRGEKHYFYGQHLSDEQKQKMVDSKRENFIEKYHLNEIDFKNAINENTTLKQLQENFNLPDHAVRNALKWTMGSRSLRQVKKNLKK